MAFFNLEDYETVETRLNRFWEAHNEDGKVETELVRYDNGHYIVKAKIFVGERQVATGLADEHTTDKGVNARNALENAETSAIGRALANYNFAPKGKRPSREEMMDAFKSAQQHENDVEAFLDAMDNFDRERAKRRILFSHGKRICMIMTMIR